MKIFISWSGEDSHKIASELKEWLPNIIQRVQPFISSRDIQSGGRWFDEIGSQLESTDFGIVCLTPSNLSEPWVLFEAGALSKRVARSHVVPLLIGLKPTDLEGPLAQFQAETTQRDHIWRLVGTINKELKENALQDTQLTRGFEKFWPDLEAVFSTVLASIQKGGADKKRVGRSVEAMLEETLNLTRGISNTVSVMETRNLLPIIGPSFGIPVTAPPTVYGLTQPSPGSWAPATGVPVFGAKPGETTLAAGYGAFPPGHVTPVSAGSFARAAQPAKSRPAGRSDEKDGDPRD